MEDNTVYVSHGDVTFFKAVHEALIWQTTTKVNRMPTPGDDEGVCKELTREVRQLRDERYYIRGTLERITATLEDDLPARKQAQAVGLIDNREDGADVFAHVRGRGRTKARSRWSSGPGLGQDRHHRRRRQDVEGNHRCDDRLQHLLLRRDGRRRRDGRSLKEEMQAVKGQVLAVLDETDQYLSGEDEEVKQAQKFAKTLNYICKKLDGDQDARQASALLVGHTQGETAAEIRRLTLLVA